jgi:flagellar basal-body rod protein FlgB
MSLIADNTMRALERSLDFKLERQQLLASNIANADTPNYKPKDLDFEGNLRSAMGDDPGGRMLGLTNQGHMGTSGGFDHAHPELVERVDVANSMDHNGVDLDQELVRYTENGIRYSATLEMMKRRHGMLTYTVMKMSGGA